MLVGGESEGWGRGRHGVVGGLASIVALRLFMLEFSERRYLHTSKYALTHILRVGDAIEPAEDCVKKALRFKELCGTMDGGRKAWNTVECRHSLI